MKRKKKKCTCGGRIVGDMTICHDCREELFRSFGRTDDRQFQQPLRTAKVRRYGGTSTAYQVCYKHL